ncbi:MAG: glutamine--fructose-6-phosphate transaminase (isomerizing) [Cytophagales bacterium]|nr:glutamine--fructose-6-phosphate transaminase (isomerizing) [Cytophagales bacterium]
MCGIIAYTGKKEKLSFLLKGLLRMEYRGYDSAGLSYLGPEGKVQTFKGKGKVLDLEKQVHPNQEVSFCTGIAHTRWATHGEPNDVNAHPHSSKRGLFFVVHNGIIENYKSLKEELLALGHGFESDTDTEVLAHFMEQIYLSDESLSMEKVVGLTLSKVVGAYALAILSPRFPDSLIVVKRGSPLVVGIRDKDYLVASDVRPLAEYTHEVIYLEDEQMAVLSYDKPVRLMTLSHETRSALVERIDIELDSLEKGNYSTFMEKEIFAQPQALKDTMRGRVGIGGNLTLGGIRDYMDVFKHTQKITMIGCGTSWHACLLGEYIFEDLCRIPVEIEYASEFRYRNPIIHSGDVVIALSQSGETADTLAALSLAKAKGANIIGIVNAVGSSIARITDAGIYLHAGPEIGVASTKAFTTQLLALIMMALRISQERRSMPVREQQILIQALQHLPQLLKKTLDVNEKVKTLAKSFQKASNFLYLGRGMGFPVALEGALKLKEISYIHAEGYPAAEMKHGPIAMIDEAMPVIFLIPKDSSYDKIVSNLEEVKARKGRVISVITEQDSHVESLSDHVIQIPKTHEILSPILSIVPLQLLAYHMAILRGCDVDQPRNLAKSVTVE